MVMASPSRTCKCSSLARELGVGDRNGGASSWRGGITGGNTVEESASGGAGVELWVVNGTGGRVMEAGTEFWVSAGVPYTRFAGGIDRSSSEALNLIN